MTVQIARKDGLFEAMRYTEQESVEGFLEFTEHRAPISKSNGGSYLLVGTPRGIITLPVMSWLVKDNRGELFVYGEIEFNHTFVIVENSPAD